MLRYIHGARVGYTHESWVMTSALAYIDDCVLLSDSSAGFKEQVRRLNEFYEWAGLSINNSKCAVVAHDFATGADMCTDHVRINGARLPQHDQHDTYKYLGLQIAIGGSWAREKARVKRDIAACILALKGSPYNPRQLDQVVWACILQIFRYGAGLVDWTSKELDGITAMWANARRLAWKLAPGTPHCLHTLHRLDGGGDLPHAKVLWAKEMTSLWSTCRQYDDELRTMALWEWENSPLWIGCHNDGEAAAELTKPLQEVNVSDLSNRYRRVFAQLGTKVTWRHEDIHQQSTTVGQSLITTTLRQGKSRSNHALLAESAMWDSTPLALRLRRALKVLNRHKVLLLRTLTLPNGKWKPFRDLPVPKEESGWSNKDYEAVCGELSKTCPEAARVWRDSELKQGQQVLQLVKVSTLLLHNSLVAPGTIGSSRVMSEKFRRMVGVSDPGQQGDSYWCHFRPHRHPKDEWVPEQWNSDGELGDYLVKAAAVLTVQIGSSSWKVTANCVEVFRD